MAILLIINGLAVWITNSQVESRLAAIRAAGDPVSLIDFQMEEVSPEENAVTYLRRVKSDAEALAKELEPIWQRMDDRAAVSEDERLKAVPDVVVVPNEDELKAIESAFANYSKVIPLLKQAANCPGYFVDYQEKMSDVFLKDARTCRVTHPVVETVFDLFCKDTQEARMFARILTRGRFFVLMKNKQYDEAVRDNIVLLKLCRLMEKEPVLVNFLIRIALRGMALERLNRVLQAGPVSEKVRQELEEELAKTDIGRDHLQALKTDRAFSLDYFEETYGNTPWYSKVFWNWQKLGVCDASDWAIDRATVALSSGLAPFFGDDPKVRGMYGKLVIPGYQATESAAHRVEIQIRMLRVLNALGRRDDPEKEPLADLSDLGLPKSVAIDPFSGKPLIVKKVDGGWLIYSVGENRIDDGGKLGEKKRLDIGLQPVVQIQVQTTPAEEE